MKPLLSLVTSARNDNYMGNSNWRFETTINFIADKLAKIGKVQDVEFIVTDWGSDIPLHTVLSLTQEAQQISRFILVPFSLAKKINRDSSFAATIAINVGIRRAQGKFICLTCADVIWSEEFLQRLFDILSGKYEIGQPLKRIFFIFSRKNIPIEIVNQNPSLEYVDGFIQENGDNLTIDKLNPYFLAPAGSLMMHRERWYGCHGCDEKLIYWGWSDIDLVLRMRLRNYFCINMGKEHDMYTYHLQHYSSGYTPPKWNPQVFNPFVVNDNNWGLANYQFEEFPPTTTPLDVSGVTATKILKNDKHYYRIKHLLNLMKFACSNMNRKNLSLTISTLIKMLVFSPEGTIERKLYFYLRRVKRIGRGLRRKKDETKQM